MNRFESLTFRHLEAVLTVARLGSMIGASELLHISASQTSRLVSQAEAALGARLFDRVGPRVVLNSTGQSLLPRLQKLSDDWQIMRRLAPAISNGSQGTLTLGFSRLSALTILGTFVRKVMSAMPDLSLHLVVQDDRSLEESLSAKRIDLALLTSPTLDHSFVVRSVHFDPFRLVHRLGGEVESVGFDDARFEAVFTAPFIHWPGNWSIVKERCDALGIRPGFVESINDAMGRMALCLARPAAALVTEVRRASLAEGLFISPIVGFEDMGYTTVVAAHSAPTPIAQRVFEHLHTFPSPGSCH